MQYKLLAVSSFASQHQEVGVNIGDYIQALAASQYYPHIDGFIDRDDSLKSYDGETCKMIMNGWYMRSPINWPPSEKITPLFVAFHLNNTIKGQMLTTESINYLRKHTPIGCRDYNTLRVLRDCGVDAYFSGCMTLTLGKKYQAKGDFRKTYIVDPPLDVSLTVKQCIEGIIETFKHPKDVVRLYKNPGLTLHHGRNIAARFIKTALFYKEYTRMFGRNLIMTSEYISQDNDHYLDDFPSDELRLKEAERLVEKYANASLVLTSRIHCALPCLGLSTPVVFLSKIKDTDESRCRMEGLEELFNTVNISEGHLSATFDVTLPITATNCPPNKDSWKPLARALDERCTEFITQN